MSFVLRLVNIAFKTRSESAMTCGKTNLEFIGQYQHMVLVRATASLLQNSIFEVQPRARQSQRVERDSDVEWLK